MVDETLLDIVVTTEDREECIALIDQLLSLIYTNDSSLLSFLHSDIPEIFSKFFLNYLQTTVDSQSKERILRKLRDEVSHLEKISITVAFRPSRNSLEKMASQVRKQYGSNMVMEVHYNPEIIAGAEIVYKGIYRDVTSRKKLDEVLNAMKGKAL